ncbi:hypothetical protein DPMN_176679 [Dreissena polymorpha]|uniref:Uncharacterized protein n=1 Tax=Dreissena polymorpha TaxID=45954 RepID=A0A9D4IKU9_DREPO|nr:hypothetical protein DPMN_176679 [Dreissena polymorpha]
MKLYGKLHYQEVPWSTVLYRESCMVTCPNQASCTLAQIFVVMAAQLLNCPN